ncbi:LuxR C-terminal-related transcriptional regulator [Polymorphospora lycopeni]|uniref:Response regulator transcription factor n=1 Tax=Polymorphospora lycopeni TaxID=3140240 RepID=A0ABV5D187_9ACTN
MKVVEETCGIRVDPGSNPTGPPGATGTIRLLLLVDRPIIRDAIRALFEAAPDFVLTAGHDAGRPVPAGVDVILVDLQLRDRDGIAVAADLVRGDGPGVVMLADTADDADVDRAARAGVRGYLLEDDETALLMAGVKAVAAGDAWWSPRAARHLLAAYRRVAAADTPRRDPQVAGLTPRERGVIRLIALGRSNAEIATELLLGRATVKTHVSRVLTKLKLRDRTQLAAFAHRNGLV